MGDAGAMNWMPTPSSGLLNFAAGLAAAIGMSYFGFLVDGDSGGRPVWLLTATGIAWLLFAAALAAWAEQGAEFQAQLKSHTSSRMGPAELGEVRAHLVSGHGRRVRTSIVCSMMSLVAAIGLSIRTFSADDSPCTCSLRDVINSFPSADTEM